MRKKSRKREIDYRLLESIFAIEKEWKQIKSIVENSIEPADTTIYKQKVAQAKYMFLLKEARKRNISAIHFR